MKPAVSGQPAMGSAIRSEYVESGSRFLLDSVILIDHFNGIKKATDYLKTVAAEACISAITRAEVLTGFQDPTKLEKAREMLDRFHLIVIDAAIADSAAELRREHRWKLPDALQAAAAKKNGLTLVTRNVKDFPPDRYEFVQIPYEV
jgi:predicted nucleic acid-binding protein